MNKKSPLIPCHPRSVYKSSENPGDEKSPAIPKVNFESADHPLPLYPRGFSEYL